MNSIQQLGEEVIKTNSSSHVALDDKTVEIIINNSSSSLASYLSFSGFRLKEESSNFSSTIFYLTYTTRDALSSTTTEQPTPPLIKPKKNDITLCFALHTKVLKYATCNISWTIY